MALISNRSIQYLLDECVGWLPDGNCANLITRLNKSPTDEALATEWELIIMSGLSLMGTVQHEPDLGTPKRLDFRFSTSDTGLEMVGDITTVSDLATRAKSIHAFSEALRRQLGKSGFQMSSHTEVSTEVNLYGRVTPRLPPVQDFSKYIFTPSFWEFVRRVASGGDAETLEIHNEFASLRISLKLGPGNCSIRHREISAPRDPRRNVIYKRIHDKSSQMNKSGHEKDQGLRCLIVCDGGCSALYSRKSFEISDLKEIVDTFFVDHSSIDVVLFISIDERIEKRFPDDQSFRFLSRGIDREKDGLALHIASELERCFARLPRPTRSPVNARLYIDGLRARNRDIFLNRHYAGSSWTRKSAEFSARATLDFLTGKIDQKHFGLAVPEDLLRRLLKDIDEGGWVEAIELVPKPDRDDDLIRITLAEFDASAGRFRAPWLGPLLKSR